MSDTLRYYACPDCWGLSAEEEGGEYCERCNSSGSIAEYRMTPEEIEANRRFWEADAEARNNVDYSWE